MTFGEFILDILQAFTMALLFLSGLVCIVTAIEESAAWRNYWRREIKHKLRRRLKWF